MLERLRRALRRWLLQEGEAAETPRRLFVAVHGKFVLGEAECVVGPYLKVNTDFGQFLVSQTRAQDPKQFRRLWCEMAGEEADTLNLF